MTKERSPQCLMGNGECPAQCKLHDHARTITEVFGDRFDPQESRRRMLFADAENPSVSLMDVITAASMCELERVRRESGENDST